MTPPAKDETPAPVTVGGLDPGPKPGTCVLVIHAQTDPQAGPMPPAVELRWGVDLDTLLECEYLAIERYVLQPRSGKSKDKGAQTATLVMAEEMYARALADVGRAAVQYVGPGNVKPWATDRRLERYGLLDAKGHHRDAVRHALYMAVRRGLLPRR